MNEYTVRIKPWLKLFLKILIAVYLVWWISTKGFLDIGQLIRLTRWYHILLGTLICGAIILINNWRWLLLIEGQEISTGFNSLLPYTFIGLFFNYVVLGGVGGDVVKGFYLVRGKKKGRLLTLASIIMDRFVGMWAISLLALSALLIEWNIIVQHEDLRWMGLMIFMVFCCFCLLFTFCFFVSGQKFKKYFAFFAKLPGGSFVQQVYEAIHSYSRKPAILFKAFLLSIVSQSMAVFFIVLIGSILQIQGLGLSSYFFVVPLGSIAMAMPIAPAGIGVGQAVLFFLFNAVIGEESQLGPISITAFQVLMFVWSLWGAYFYVRQGHLRKGLSHIE